MVKSGHASTGQLIAGAVGFPVRATHERERLAANRRPDTATCDEDRCVWWCNRYASKYAKGLLADPLDEESDSSDEDISSDSDSSDEEEGIEVISAEDSSDEEAKTQLIRKQSAQTAGTIVIPATPKPTSEKGTTCAPAIICLSAR